MLAGGSGMQGGLQGEEASYAQQNEQSSIYTPAGVGKSAKSIRSDGKAGRSKSLIPDVSFQMALDGERGK